MKMWCKPNGNIIIRSYLLYKESYIILPAEQLKNLNTNGVDTFSDSELVSHTVNQLIFSLLPKQNTWSTLNLNDQTNADIFILDRDQPAQSSQRPSTPQPNYNISIPPRINITYEIIKMQDQHVVLCHEEQPTDTTNAENENGVIRRFTQDNPVIPEDAFISPVRQFDQEIPAVPEDGFDSPISFNSSSEGYYSGSDWDTNSAWRAYDSMRDDLSTLFETPIRSTSQSLLPEETAQRSRGLSQPQMSCENCHEISAVYGEGEWEKVERKEQMKQSTYNSYVLI